jgi:hypothetical protein
LLSPEGFEKGELPAFCETNKGSEIPGSFGRLVTPVPLHPKTNKEIKTPAKAGKSILM